MKNTICAFVGVLLMAGLSWLVGCRPSTISTNDPADLAPESGATIGGQYIVVLKQEAFSQQPLESYSRQQTRLETVAKQFLAQFSVSPDKIVHIYGAALPGFAVRLTPTELAQLRKSPLVSYIEADRISDGIAGEVLANPDGAREAALAGIQEVPWGITDVGGFINYTGQNVAYVIDCGIESTHPDLKVDTTRGYSVFKSGVHKSTRDYDGHGTLVSGMIAAINNTQGVVGVAAGATVVPVKVCVAPTKVATSDLISGINFVTASARPGDVANISLGIDRSDALDQAVINMAARGTYVAVSAGNTNTGQAVFDANQLSPARANGVNLYTAAGHDRTGNFATVSCSGNPPIDFSTPAVNCRSTYKGASYLVITQGTTSATAHLSGILLATGGVVYPNGTVTNDPDGNPDVKASRIPR